MSKNHFFFSLSAFTSISCVGPGARIRTPLRQTPTHSMHTPTCQQYAMFKFFTILKLNGGKRLRRSPLWVTAPCACSVYHMVAFHWIDNGLKTHWKKLSFACQSLVPG